MQVVVFNIGPERFAVETSKVQTIADMMKVTKVPKAPDYIKGLVNLRGNVLSILDINLLLGMVENENEKENMIILNLEDETMGITVDSVEEVMEVEDEMLERVHSETEKPYIRGVINMNDRIITLVDFDKLLP